MRIVAACGFGDVDELCNRASVMGVATQAFAEFGDGGGEGEIDAGTSFGVFGEGLVDEFADVLGGLFVAQLYG